MKLELLKGLQWSHALRGRIILPIVVVSRFLDLLPAGVEIGRQRRTLALLQNDSGLSAGCVVAAPSKAPFNKFVVGQGVAL